MKKSCRVIFFSLVVATVAAGPLRVAPGKGARCLIPPFAEALDRMPPPAGISLQTRSAYYTPGEDISVSLSLQTSASCRAVGFLAFRNPDGNLLFYNREDGAFSEGEAGAFASWTPYGSTAVSLASGIDVSGIEIFRGSSDRVGFYQVFAILLDEISGQAVSNVAVSYFSILRNRLVIVNKAVHVGDRYESYMMNWEEPIPEGVTVSRSFVLDDMPKGDVGMRALFFATYYDNDPVYLNGKLLGYLPGQMNANMWRRAVALIPSELFLRGVNVLTFKSGRHPITGHYDDYMVKDVNLYYN